MEKYLQKAQSKVNQDHYRTIQKGNNVFDYQKILTQIQDVQKKHLFFIMAVPKSGTTWLQHLINGHPQMSCSGEGNFNHFMDPLKDLLKSNTL